MLIKLPPRLYYTTSPVHSLAPTSVTGVKAHNMRWETQAYDIPRSVPKWRLLCWNRWVVRVTGHPRGEYISSSVGSWDSF